MDKLVLDTNVLIHLARGNKVAEEVKRFVDSKANPQVFISIVSKAEAESLVVQWGWGERKTAVLRKLIDGFLCIDISQDQNALIDAYVEIDAFSQGKKPTSKGVLWRDSSRNMGKNDLWIAATAYVLEAELLTTDGDFNHLNEHWITVKRFNR